MPLIGLSGARPTRVCPTRGQARDRRRGATLARAEEGGASGGGAIAGVAVACSQPKILSGSAGEFSMDVPLNTPGDRARAAAAERWFGYGRWTAPYWFVRMEQGGDEAETRSYLAWEQLGAAELLDCRKHHLAIDDPFFRRWYAGNTPPTQSTWRRLIQLLFAYKGLPCTTEHVRAYQRDHWGSEHGVTAVLEISAVRARSLSVQVGRQAHRDVRIATLRERLACHRPAFAVFYGTGYRAEYERVAGSSFDADGFAWSGDTLCALTKHPVARGSAGAEWETCGRAIRSRLDRAG